jgi:hypothetical protein
MEFCKLAPAGPVDDVAGTVDTVDLSFWLASSFDLELLRRTSAMLAGIH